MPERSGYTPGTPSWADVTVPDLEAGKAFYGGLFGWNFQSMPADMGRYTMCEINGWRVAGMMPMTPDMQESPRWNVYIATDDANATAESVTAAGGQVLMGPEDVPGEGRMLYAKDPTGATVGFWQAEQFGGAQLVAEPGAMVWQQLATRDPQRADQFYRALFRYDVQPMDGQVTDAALYAIDGTQVGSRMRMTDEWPRDLPSHWMNFFMVSDTDMTAERARELGGSVVYGPTDSPYGRFATLVDPFGASFSVIVPTGGSGA
jgi:predicted enzyme related to lactoylglutathione lyase